MTPRYQRGAFTVLEAVVTLGLVVTVAAILAPVVDQARQASRTARCLANLKDQGVLVSLYAHDNGDYLPPWDRVSVSQNDLAKRLFYDQILEETVQNITPRDFEESSWLSTGGGGPVGIFRCPSVPTTVGSPALVYAPIEGSVPPLTQSHSGYSHYQVNDYLLAAHVYEPDGGFRVIREDPAHPERADTNLRLRDLEQPKSRLVVKDVKVWRAVVRLGVAASISRYKEHSMHNENLPLERKLPGQPVVLHKAGMNMLYADGHAQTESDERSFWVNPIDSETSLTRYEKAVLGY